MENQREQMTPRVPVSHRANNTLVPLLVAEFGTRLSGQLPPGLRRYGDDITGHLVEQMLPPLPPSARANARPGARSGPRSQFEREAPVDFTAGVMARISVTSTVLSEAEGLSEPRTATPTRMLAVVDASDPPTAAPLPPPLSLRTRICAILVTLGFILLLIATAVYLIARTDPSRALAVAEMFGGIGLLVLAFGRVLVPMVSLPILGSLFAVTSSASILHLSHRRRECAAMDAHLSESEAA